MNKGFLFCQLYVKCPVYTDSIVSYQVIDSRSKDFLYGFNQIFKDAKLYFDICYLLLALT